MYILGKVALIISHSSGYSNSHTILRNIPDDMGISGKRFPFVNNIDSKVNINLFKLKNSSILDIVSTSNKI